MATQEIDKDWFIKTLGERNKSVRGLAKHMELDASAVSRMFSGQRKMKMNEANAIASFLAVPVREVLRHAGVSMDLDGQPTRILLAATINEKGMVERLKESSALPQTVIDRAHAAIAVHGNSKIVAAQVRAASGPLAVMDDAVILFKYTEAVDSSAIGVLSICRTHDGQQMLAKIERARKTGEARVVLSSGEVIETLLQTATPVIAIIP